MGLFTGLIGGAITGITNIFSSKSKAKQAEAEAKASAERTKQAQIESDRILESQKLEIENLKTISSLDSAKIMSYLPYVGIGGAVIGLGIWATKK